MENHEQEHPELNLKEIFAQLLARKVFLLFTALVGLILGAFYAVIAPNEYRASAVVQIEKRSDGVSLPTELIGTLLSGEGQGASSFSTETHVIKSRLILEPVARELGLLTRVRPVSLPIWGDFIKRHDLLSLLPALDAQIPSKYARGGEILRVADLEVDVSLQGRPFTLKALGGSAYEFTVEGETYVGTAGEPLDLGGLGSLFVAELVASAGRMFEVTHLPTREIVAQIARSLDIRERSGGVHSGTGIIDFSVTGVDEARVVPVVNEVIRTYQAASLRRRSAEIDQSIEFIAAQLPNLIQDVDAAQAAITEFRDRNQDAGELSLGTQDILIRLVELEASEERLAYEMEEILKRVTPKHPDYLSLGEELVRVRAKLASERRALASIPQAEQEFALLTRDLERARSLEIQLSERIEQLKILKASTVGNIRVLEPAEVPRQVGPDRVTPLVIGMLAALILAAIYTLVRNYFRVGIEDGRELERIGIPLFGTISKVASITRGARDTNYLIAKTQPDEPVVEAFRGLRTALSFTMKTHDSGCILITSCAPGDGKSFVSSNLAVIFADKSRRTLLIDADMRRGKLRRAFGARRNALGLSDALTGDCTFDEATRDTDIENLCLISTGKRPPNPAELLDSKPFADLVEWANSAFDVVVIDAPPVLAVTDPLILARHCAVNLLVVNHVKTAEAEVVAANRTLQNSGISLNGAILNAYDQRKSRYGSYGYKYGYYYGGYNYNYSKD
jgi:tyrosine-protein kinase Etk/Wzc